MDPVEPHIATLRAAAGRVEDARSLPSAPLTAIRRRARHLRRRRQVGSGLAVLAVAGVGAVAVVGRPAPSEQVNFGASPGVGPGGTAPLTTVPGVPAPVYVRIFMNPVATRDQLDGLRATLDGESGISPVVFVNQQQAYEEFQEMFRDRPELVESARPEVLPTSFIVGVGVNETLAEVFAAQVKTRAGVREVLVVDQRAKPGALRESMLIQLLGSHVSR